MTDKTPREARLEIRLTREQKWLVERAAAARGASVAEFARQAMQTAAAEAVAEQEVLRLCAADQLAFAAALSAPTEPGDRLRLAYKRYRERTED
jgi:uncharacterized protein (DUF1778 family)